MNKKSTGLLLSILGVLSLVLITAGVTYAFFSYTKEGDTANTISTGTITFYYDEQEATGNGIKIENALPMSDSEGIALQDANQYFNFKVTSTISGDTTIPYEVTAKKQDGSTLADSSIKLYLTATGSETAGTNNTFTTTTDDNGTKTIVKTFADLPKTTVQVANQDIEKTLFKGTVPAKSNNYQESFTLKMWINGEDTTDTAIDYSPYEFVLKTAVNGSTEALNADALITAESFIKSTDYYALPETTTTDDSTGETVTTIGKDAYERVAYVNSTARKIYTVSQVKTEAGFTIENGVVTAAPSDFVANEQFYAISGQKFSVKVNVYANATVVTDDTGSQG